jgi:hypothetical protein
VVAAEIGVNPKRIALLFVVVAALGGYLFFYELPKAEREAQKDKLVDVAQDDVIGIELDFPDRKLVLQKDGKTWKLVQPIEAQADDAAMQSLLLALVNAEVQRTLDDLPKDLAPFGLDRPNPTVTLTVKNGSVPPIHVGAQTKIGQKTYVRLGDEQKLLLSPSNLKLALDKQPKDLRDKTMLAFEDDAVTRLEIDGSGEPVVLSRTKDDVWTVTPGDYPADATEVNSYLSSLRATRAVDFPDDAPADLAKYGLAEPKLRVTVTAGSGESAAASTLSLGGETTEGTTKRLYAMRSDRPGVVTVGDWSQKNLDKSVATFRDKTVFAFDPAEVSRVALQRRAGVGVNLERGADGSWSVPGTKGSQPVAITALLDDLRDLRGADVVTDQAGDLAAYGLNAPALRITLYGKDGKPLGTVLATNHDGKFYAMREGQPTVYGLRDYMFTRLDKQEKDFLPGAAPAAPALPGGAPVPPPAAPPVPGG